jgi:hypothetical protein
MPHKGRSYPFHPTYWSTEAWFWPGYCPWKLKALRSGVDPDPWDFCLLPTSMISLPGVPTADAKKIFYQFILDGICLVSEIDVTMELGLGPDGQAAQWTVTAKYWDSTQDTDVAFQVFPQRQVDSPVFHFEVPDPGCEPFDDVWVKFQPANYEEGGSPYPRVPPGPP